MLGAHFEDLQLGFQYVTPGVTLTEDAIIRFGLEWDTQPFHVDAQAAEASMFGSLIASGLQTVLLTYRMFHQVGQFEGTGLAGLGYDRIRFHRPVRPRETLRVRVSIDELRRSRTKQGGIVTLSLETLNQDDETVLSLSVAILIALQENATSAAHGQDIDSKN